MGGCGSTLWGGSQADDMGWGKGDSGRGKGVSSGWVILAKTLKLPGLLLLTYEKIFFFPTGPTVILLDQGFAMSGWPGVCVTRVDF